MSSDQRWPEAQISTSGHARVRHPRPDAKVEEAADGELIAVITNDNTPNPRGKVMSMHDIVSRIWPALTQDAQRLLWSALRTCRWATRQDRRFVDKRVRRHRNGKHSVMLSPVEGTRGHEVWMDLPTSSFTPSEGTAHDWQFRMQPQQAREVEKLQDSVNRMQCQHFDAAFVAQRLDAVDEVDIDTIPTAVDELARFGLVRRFEIDGMVLRFELNPELFAQLPAGQRTTFASAVPQDAQAHVQPQSNSVVAFSTDIADADEPAKAPTRLTKADLSAMVAQRDAVIAEQQADLADRDTRIAELELLLRKVAPDVDAVRFSDIEPAHDTGHNPTQHNRKEAQR